MAEQGRHELRAEQRCAQLAEECKQRSLQSDEVVQQLAQQDREVARQKFEAVSVSRRLRQTQADADVVNEDLRIEAQRDSPWGRLLEALEVNCWHRTGFSSCKTPCRQRSS